MTAPLLSVIIPSFNQGRFIQATIESCLAQDHRPIEVIVIDGASTDGTLDVLRRYDGCAEVRWQSEPDSGVVEAVNKGLALARGEIAAIQSSDDVYLPGAASSAVRTLLANPELGFVFGDIAKIDAAGHHLETTALGAFSIEDILAVRTWIPQPACFFRLALARELGGWREEVAYAADTDLWFRMMLRTGARKIDRVLAGRRVHGAQRDKQGERIVAAYTRMVREWFEVYGAPSRYRPAAEAGVLLQMNRYGYGEPEAVKRQRLREAVRLYPPLASAGPRRHALPRLNRLRAWAGCWLHERWRTECALNGLLSRLTGIRWVDLHNRIERLRAGGDTVSRVCDWQWTSDLTVCRVFPGTAVRLCQACFRDWPLGSGSPERPMGGREPRISIILPVGGASRYAALGAVVESFRRQTAGDLELIVVEQSAGPAPAGLLPPGVIRLPIPGDGGEEGFNKSRLMNAAVRIARAPWVLLHDADIVVPRGYVEAVLARAAAGWEAVRPIRFLFYLDKEQTTRVMGGGLPARIERVAQNFPGGSVAVRREMYWQLGGHDERFVGWGGEDTEFLDRLRTCREFPGHFAPALHLWHPPAPKKASGDRNQAMLDRQRAVPVDRRVRDLRGQADGAGPV